MTNLENIKNMTIDELSTWLDAYGSFDDAPWTNWFNKTYCNPKNCPSLLVNLSWDEFQTRKAEVAYCELNHKCRFFEELSNTPSNKEVIKMWLEQEKEN